MTIRHAGGSYEVAFGNLSEAMQALPENRRIVTDENVAAALGIPTDLVLPAGETNKSLDGYAEAARALARTRANRRTTLVALGGGVIGDLVGFLAASYMRGVPFVQVPTSLLAMVDSSVGGKVGIDIPEGKNLLGAFYPPVAVHVPLDALSTLPERQVANGMAEVWKTGFIRDEHLVARLEADPTPDRALIERCVAHKAAVVEADEYETNGIRATLNFGHTIGHAIERVQNYEGFLHGEAIAVGMVLESRLGERLGHTDPGTTERVSAGLASQGLPTEWPVPDPDALIDAMRMDKKAEAGRLAFSLLDRIGSCRLWTDVPEKDVRAVLEG
ncbi:3-dehydroquinate synthase [bacterium]|nr:MAG: 3-dehydroquinate synthase [bacterium]